MATRLHKENVNYIRALTNLKATYLLNQKSWVLRDHLASYRGLYLVNDTNFCPAPRPEWWTEYSFGREIFWLDFMSVDAGFLWLPQIQLWPVGEGEMRRGRLRPFPFICAMRFYFRPWDLSWVPEKRILERIAQLLFTLSKLGEKKPIW